MSNSASIAAAKRRRGASQNPPVAGTSSASSSRNINRVQSEPTLEKGERTQQKISPIQILGMHENRLEFLERQHNNMAMALNQYPNPNEEKIVTLKDLEDFRQAFQKLSSNEKKTKDGIVNLEQIKKEVSEEFTKNQLTNLVSKKDVDTMISLMRKELINDNFKSLEDKINELKNANDSQLTKKVDNIQMPTDIITLKQLEAVKSELTKKVDNIQMPTDIITLKQLEAVKSELTKKVDNIQMPTDIITLKQLDAVKSELTKKVDNIQMPVDIITLKQLDAVKSELTKKVDNIQIPTDIITFKQLDAVKSELTKKVDNIQMPTDIITLKQLDAVKSELTKKVDNIQMPTDIITLKQLDAVKSEFFTKLNSLSLDNDKMKTVKNSEEGKLSLTNKTRIDTLENKVKALEAIILNK